MTNDVFSRHTKGRRHRSCAETVTAVS